MRIAVTGASGMIGSTLIEAALEKGYEVIAIVRPQSARNTNLPVSPDLKTIESDISDIDRLSGIESCDIFFHLAWRSTSVDGRDDVHVQYDNIGDTLRAVDVANSWGASTFVGVGSQAEYGTTDFKLRGDLPVNPESGYGVAKYAAGKLAKLLCNQLGMKFCWARVLSVYGEKDADHTLIMYLIKTLLDGKVPELTECEQIWDYIYSGDAADALLAIGEHGIEGKTYCIGSGDCRPLKEYVKDVRDEINPDAGMEFGAREYYPHQAMMLCADISELTEDTGFMPKYSFKDGISRTVAHVRKSQNSSKKS